MLERALTSHRILLKRLRVPYAIIRAVLQRCAYLLAVLGAEEGGGVEPGGGEVGVVEVGEGFGVEEGGFEGGGEGVVVVGVGGDEVVVLVGVGEVAEEGFGGEVLGVDGEEELVGFFGVIFLVVDLGDRFGGEVFDFGVF